MDMKQLVAEVHVDAEGRKQAQRALWRMGQMDKAIDHKQEEHVRMYLALKTMHSKVTAEMLRSSGVLSRETVASVAVETTFWAVPKDGREIPLVGLQWVVPKKTLEEATAVDVTFDLDAFWIIDQACPRHHLGGGVSTVKFSMGSLSRLKHDRAATGTPKTDSKGEVEVVGRPASSTVAAGAKAPLRRRDSEGSDSEAVTLSISKDLVAQVRDAAARGAFYLRDRNSSGSVEFWVRAIIESLEDAKKKWDVDVLSGAPGHAKTFALSLGTQQPIFELFPKFLAKLFLDNPCYKDLTHFTDLIKRLETVAFGPMPPLLQVVHSLARLSAASNEQVDTAGTDITMKATFYQSALYADFIAHRSRERLAHAKSESVGAAVRMQLLEELSSQANASTPVEVKTEASMARSMLTQQIRTQQKVRLCMEAPDHVSVLANWDSKHVLLAVRHFTVLQVLHSLL